MKPKLLFFLTLILFFSPQISFAATFTVNRLDDPAPVAPPNGCDTGGNCSLREATLSANANGGPDTIILGDGTFDLTLTNAGDPDDGLTGDLDITDDITLQGNGPSQTIVNAQASLMDRLVHVDPNGSGINANFIGMTLQNGMADVASPHGGAILAENSGGILNLDNCLLTGNHADNGTGGALRSNSDLLTIQNTTIDSNNADSEGGGIHFNGQGLAIGESTFSKNKVASGIGGGLSCSGSSLFLSNSTINNNESGGDQGGGVYCSASSQFIENSSFIENLAGTGGGGLLAMGTNLTINNSVFQDNEGLSNANGGGLNASFDVVSIEQSTLSGNTVDEDGGGAIISASNIFIERSTFYGNTSTVEDGGGLEIDTTSLIITNSTFSGNQAGFNGGGIKVSGASISSLSNVTITDNTSGTDNPAGDGGGIYADASPIFIQNSIIAQNVDAASAPDCGDPSNPDQFISQGYNILGTNEGCTYVSGAGDFEGTTGAEVDAGLLPLADNGGPTQTHGLDTDSLARNNGNPAGCANAGGGDLTIDQRGQQRPGDGDRCDIGAYEAGVVDLEVKKSADPSNPDIGANLTYTVTVTNKGPDKDFEVTLTDTLSPNVDFVSVSTDRGSCTEANKVVTCNLGEMGGGQTILVTLVVTTKLGGSIANVAMVAGTETDSNPDNNSVTLDTQVGPTEEEGGDCSIGKQSNPQNHPILWMGLILISVFITSLRRKFYN